MDILSSKTAGQGLIIEAKTSTVNMTDIFLKKEIFLEK